MAGGYTEKILRVNLTTGVISTIPTSQYKQYMGGKGIGTAIFWDLCQNKAIRGTDPGNVMTLMTSPLAGTLGGSNGRLEIQGIGIYADSMSAPNKTADSSENQDWYTRANVGGRFAAALKSAGWDGIVLEGKASKLVYLKIVNDKVTLEDAAFIKGMDCMDTQLNLWGELMGNARTDEWLTAGTGMSTQRPAIMCISAAGEHQSRIACLIHDSGDAAAFGGFGGVWGSKNLKAITVQGSNVVDIADPKALRDARLWLKSKLYPIGTGPATNPTFRAAGCSGCFFPCRKRYSDSYCNDSQCIESYWYAARNLLTTTVSQGNLPGHPKAVKPFSALDQRRSTDLSQRYGINAAEIIGLHQYLRYLYENGDAGPGKKINPAPLSMESYGTLGWAEEFCREICNPIGIGKDLVEGASRFSRKYGLDARDTESGFLQALQWGNFSHFSLPNTDFSFCSMLGSRDHNEHTLQKTWGPLANAAVRAKYPVDEFVKIMAQKLIPYEGDPYMVSHGTDDVYGIYSPHQAKFISWMFYYGNSWKQSALYCDQTQLFASFIDQGAGVRTKYGMTPEAEPMFWNAVTGQNLSFKDGMIKGKAIGNLERAIWALQGRHRDQEKFAGFAFKDGACFGGCGKNEYDPVTFSNVQYMYPVGPHIVTYTGADRKTVKSATHCYPVYKDGKWAYDFCDNFKLDKAGVETFKTNYYTLEGWDTATGRPTRAALTGADLKNVGIDLTNVGDALQAAGKLGK